MKEEERIPAAINSQTNSIALVRAQQGESVVISFLNLCIIDLLGWFNLNLTMNDTQVENTSKMIAQDFWQLNIEDLRLVFDNIKKGIYGKVYDRIDGQMIYLAFGKYWRDRVKTASEITDAVHVQAKAGTGRDDRKIDFPVEPKPVREIIPKYSKK